ncbi:MAG: hypothetical protein BalsKO_12110 [Balneolaceae bacterium]
MDFQGFQNSLPTFIILFIGILLIVVAVLSYRNLKSIPTLPRIGFISLRATAFIILLILFLNPYFFSSEIVKENPKILVLLDNSESSAIEKGDYKGKESYLEALGELNLSPNPRLNFEFFTLGSSTKQIISPDSLTLNQSETNFASAISQIQELEDDFDAGIIISDGIITFGRNPVIQASSLTIPLYTIALGDTSKVKDIAIKNLVFNPNGYTNTRHTIEVEVSQNGFLNQETTVKILNSAGELMDEQEIIFEIDDQTASLDLQIELNEQGLQQYSVIVGELNDEWTLENNTSNLSIDVSDSKTKVLHISFEVHPDVKMLRSILNSDQNIELSTLTWLGGTRFIETQSVDISEQDLLIVHGLPTTELNTSILENYDKIPSIYLQLPKSRSNEARVFSELELIRNTGNRFFQINITPYEENLDHPIMELPEIGYQNISPLVSSLRALSNSPDALDLLKLEFQGVETPNDIISVVERGNIRRSAISAWAWYRMYQSPNSAERDFVTQLFLNIATWSSNNPDERRLKISPARPVFNLSEEVTINANLNNESGSPESGASIEILLNSPNSNEERTFTMSNEGGGTYQLDISALSSGLYSYKADARKGDRLIDSQSGEFLVQDSNSELINTIRNDGLLKTIAYETGGEFFVYDDLDGFWDQLNNDQILNQKEEIVESYSFPIRSFFWFAFVLALLATEWFGRKYYSLP